MQSISRSQFGRGHAGIHHDTVARLNAIQHRLVIDLTGMRHASHACDMKPAPAELVILKHLWQTKSQSAREIHDAVSAELAWSYSSTRKTLERMLDKGMLSQSESHGLNVYRARLKKVPTLAEMIRSFASDVLGLRGPLPVSNLVDSKLLSAEELEALDALLREGDDDGGGDNNDDAAKDERG